VRLWLDLATVAGLIPAAAFVVVFLRVGGWHTGAIGRNLITKAAALSVLFALSLASRLWAVPLWVWLLVVAGLDALLWQRLWILVRYQRHDRDNHPDG
jgi:hypothetical protein